MLNTIKFAITCEPNHDSTYEAYKNNKVCKINDFTDEELMALRRQCDFWSRYFDAFMINRDVDRYER